MSEMSKLSYNLVVSCLLVLVIFQCLPASSSQNISRSSIGRKISRDFGHSGWGGGGGGWGGGGGGWGGWGSGHQSGHHGHGGGFQSFFDLALTGLAFLSFGIFLLNLLLNALIGAGVVTGTLLPTNTGTGIITSTATATGTTTGRELSRRRREANFDLHLDPVTSMDALAASVLKSIDAMVEKHECLQKVFCDGNKEAKVIGSGFQFMMPAYSIGASYVGRKIGLLSTDSLSDHLRAVVLGIEESNCQSHFPHC